MSSEEPLYQYSRFGFKFEVYANRVEVEERKTFSRPRTTLLFRNIASVEIKLGGKLVFSMNDGSKKEYIIGTDAENARSAVIARL